MKETVAINRKKIDKVRSEMPNLIIYLERNSKNSKIDARLIKRLKTIHAEVEDLVIQTTLRNSLSAHDYYFQSISYPILERGWVERAETFL